MTTREVSNIIAAKVHKTEPTAQVMLFGSRARGDARPDSDWDVMVLIDDKAVDKRWYMSGELLELGWDINKTINPIIYTKSEWDKRRFTPF